MEERYRDLAKEIAELKAELREIKSLMSMMINMMMDFESMDDEPMDKKLDNGVSSDFLMYN